MRTILAIVLSHMSAIATVTCESTAAYAHSWYEPICCHDQDCARVERVEYLGGNLILTSQGKRVEIPRGFQIRPSQDNDYHVCIDPYGKVLCVYAPSGV